ncbi:hypothetical protein BJ742DRAFT_766294 [Cladochytrium replicatum]|nr:hypothetical protein BJ742DRAFT_766294 [Cladochytrium replicatum]
MSWVPWPSPKIMADCEFATVGALETRDAISVIRINFTLLRSWYQLYSALMHGFDHPSILRAIFIESTDYRGTDDFLTSLIPFSLRNYVSGSFYSGITSGHEEVETYELALSFALTRDHFSTSAGLRLERKMEDESAAVLETESLERLNNVAE